MSLAKAAPLTCTGHSRPVTHLMFSKPLPKLSQDGDLDYLLISACKDGYPMLRNGLTGDWIGTFLGHKGSVTCTRLSDDAGLAISASTDWSVIVWNAHNGEIISTLPHDHVVRSCDFHPESAMDGSDEESMLVATGGNDKKVHIWNVQSQTVVTEWAINSVVKHVLWVASRTVITVTLEGEVAWWDVALDGGPPKKAHSHQLESPVGQVEQVGGTGGMWVLVAAGTFIYLIHSTSGQIMKRIDVGYEVLGVCLKQDLSYFVTGCSKDTYIRVHSFKTGEMLNDPIRGHHGPVHALAFSHDYNLVASGSEDGTVRLWKATDKPYGLWQGTSARSNV